MLKIVGNIGVHNSVDKTVHLYSLYVYVYIYIYIMKPNGPFSIANGSITKWYGKGPHTWLS